VSTEHDKDNKASISPLCAARSVLEDVFFGFKYRFVWIFFAIFLVIICSAASPQPFGVFLGVIVFVAGWLLRLLTLSWQKYTSLEQGKQEEGTPDTEERSDLYSRFLENPLCFSSPYGYVRAPDYVAKFLIMFSLSLLSGWLFFIALVLLGYSVFLGYLFYKEERERLVSEYADDYLRYKLAVGVIFPKKPVMIAKVFSVPSQLFMETLSEQLWGIVALCLAMALISLC